MIMVMNFCVAYNAGDLLSSRPTVSFLRRTLLYVVKKLRGLSPQANYTDRATTACQ
jgi:hypothetical protein